MEHLKFENLKDNDVILLIDGNYFAHRCVHGLRMDNPNLTLDTNSDMMQFEQNLFSQFLGLYTSFNNDYHHLVANIVFAFDNQSWRKSETPHRPYFIDENSNEPIGYKDNRIAMKEKDSINYENFHYCIDNFIAKIMDVVAVFNSVGCEADDSIFLLSRFFRSKGIITLIFCTDGDLKQLVNDRVIMFRNNKSKDLPNGEVVISPNVGRAYFNKMSAQEILMGKTGMTTWQKDFYKNLFNLQLNNGKQRSNANRVLGSGITIGEYFAGSFEKVICGDKKDNIFPLFRWKAGTRNMSVTSKMFNAVIELNGYKLNDTLIVRLLAQKTDEDKDLLSTFLYGLQSKTNQIGVSKNVMVHFKHNYRMNMLTNANLPESVKESFYKLLDANFKIIDKRFTQELFIEISRSNTYNDSANILKSSIPGEKKGVNVEMTEIQSNLIDDILNS